MEIRIPVSVIHTLMKKQLPEKVVSFIHTNVTEIRFRALKENRNWLIGLCAEGETLVDDSGGHIERGYCGIEEKLRAVGGRIERVAL